MSFEQSTKVSAINFTNLLPVNHRASIASATIAYCSTAGWKICGAKFFVCSMLVVTSNF
jgi:hypothetical protein